MTDFNKTLFKHHNIKELVGVYQAAKALIEKAYGDLETAEKMLRAAGIQYAETLPDQHRGWRKGEDTTTARVLGRINERIWTHVVKLMEIRTVLSIAKAKELDDQLKEGKFPEITYDNIFNTFLAIMAQAKDFAAEQIREVYNWLLPRSETARQYKTNTMWELGKKVIKYGIERPYHSADTWKISYWYEQNYIALDKAFHILDGKAMPKENYYGPLVTAIRQAKGEQPEGETDYFRFKLYGNGNIHITFKRADLVREFNRVAGGGMLKPRTKDPGEQADPVQTELQLI